MSFWVQLVKVAVFLAMGHMVICPFTVDSRPNHCQPRKVSTSCLGSWISISPACNPRKAGPSFVEIDKVELEFAVHCVLVMSFASKLKDLEDLWSAGQLML